MAGPRAAGDPLAGAETSVPAAPGGLSRGAVARGVALATRPGASMTGGGGAAVADSPCGSWLTVGLTSGDSAGGASLPRRGIGPGRAGGCVGITDDLGAGGGAGVATATLVGVAAGGAAAAGGGIATPVRPARRSSALYFALFRSATRLSTSLSRSIELSAVSGGAGTLARLG